MALFWTVTRFSATFQETGALREERENYDLLFADFVDQPVMFNEKFPYSRIADLRNSPSPFGKSPQRAGGESG